MRRIAVTSVALFSAILLSGSRASAQDMAEMAKWAGAKLIHWHLVGDYSAKLTILPGKENMVTANVTDHLEIDFDWDNTTIVGTPVIKNFPTKVGPQESGSACKDFKVNGTPEYFTLNSISPMAVMLTLQGKQDRPAGSVSYANDDNSPCDQRENVAASSSPVTMKLQLPQAMMLAMPSTPGFEMEITKDRKSFIQKINTDGWVWTMTPTLVK